MDYLITCLGSISFLISDIWLRVTIGFINYSINININMISE
jgi:hypothetical protein